MLASLSILRILWPGDQIPILLILTLEEMILDELKQQRWQEKPSTIWLENKIFSVDWRGLVLLRTNNAVFFQRIAQLDVSQKGTIQFSMKPSFFSASESQLKSAVLKNRWHQQRHVPCSPTSIVTSKVILLREATLVTVKIRLVQARETCIGVMTSHG